MPRGGARFIGPRIKSKPKSQAEMSKLEKKFSSSCSKSTPKPKVERLINLGKVPDRLVNLHKFDSIKADKFLSKWLKNNAQLLGDFQRLLNFQALDQQKAIANKSGNLRRLRILENGSEYYSVTQVLVTYGKDCHICLTPIDLKASRRAGIGNWLLGLHIDHLVAIANGGADTLANVRPSHAICNLRKGTK